MGGARRRSVGHRVLAAAVPVPAVRAATAAGAEAAPVAAVDAVAITTTDPTFEALPADLQENVLRVLGDPTLPPAEVERLLSWEEGAVPAPRARTPAAERAGAAALAAAAVTQPDIRYDPAANVWRLHADYSVPDADLGCQLTAFEGYECDLATIPRPVRWVISPHELGALAPLFHDLIYEYRGVLPQTPAYVSPYRMLTRLDADDLFYRHMVMSGVRVWKRSLAYRAVRTFGGIWWAT